jgi:hypothetical protein
LLLDSDGVSCEDGNSNGSGDSSNNSIAVSVVPFLVDCCIPLTAITVAAKRHLLRDLRKRYS